MSAFGQQQICNNAQIGISIEPEANVQLLPNSEVSVTNFRITYYIIFNVIFSLYKINISNKVIFFQAQQVNSYVTFAQKMLENLVNFVASFSVTQDQMTPTPGVSYIPLNTLHTWYQNFERRLQQNPNFWKN